MRRALPLGALVGILAMSGCASRGGPAAGASPSGGEPMGEIAREYVHLVLALGEHDPDYVDAYYGPPEWRDEARAAGWSVAEIRERAAGLRSRLAGLTPTGDDLARERHRFLDRMLVALAARARMLAGERLTFDEESRALYDAVAPHRAESTYEAAAAELARELAAVGFTEGELGERYEAFRARYVVPSDRLDAVFTAAIEECRRRTSRHLELPAGETFRVEYVTDQPWSGYNWYQGGYASLIQVNTDLPVHVDRAVDLACHEGYPGHHAYNALLERDLVRGEGFVELSVYPLFSPQSLIAEGSANYGIDLAFPADERVAFEREVLYPLAGLDPEGAEAYARVERLKEQLSYAGNEAARRYLDGEIDAAEAAGWLERYALMSPQRAAQRVRFIDRYRSYVINYNLGEDMVRAWVEAAGPDRAGRWERFGRLLSSPMLPSDLVTEAAEE